MNGIILNPYTGDDSSIDKDNFNNLILEGNGIFLNDAEAIVSKDSNKHIINSTQGNIIAGTDNKIEVGNINSSNTSYYNFQENVILGNTNKIIADAGDTTTFPKTAPALVANNFITGQNNIISVPWGNSAGRGDNVIIGGERNNLSGSSNIAIGGLGLQSLNSHTQTVILGQYNDTSTIPNLGSENGSCFIIGNGTDKNNRSNALEIISPVALGEPSFTFNGVIEGNSVGEKLAADIATKVLDSEITVEKNLGLVKIEGENFGLKNAYTGVEYIYTSGDNSYINIPMSNCRIYMFEKDLENTPADGAWSNIHDFNNGGAWSPISIDLPNDEITTEMLYTWFVTRDNDGVYWFNSKEKDNYVAIVKVFLTIDNTEGTVSFNNWEFTPSTYYTDTADNEFFGKESVKLRDAIQEVYKKI